MLFWLAAGFGVLALLLLLGDRSASADKAKLANQLRLAGGMAGLALGGFFLLTGRFIPGLILGGAGLVMLVRHSDRLKMQKKSFAGEQAEQETPQSDQPPIDPALSRAEAILLLGLEEPFSPDDVRAAHRQLMMKHHPDQGGDTALAAKLNAAKSLLLGD